MAPKLLEEKSCLHSRVCIYVHVLSASEIMASLTDYFSHVTVVLRAMSLPPSDTQSME